MSLLFGFFHLPPDHIPEDLQASSDGGSTATADGMSIERRWWRIPDSYIDELVSPADPAVVTRSGGQDAPHNDDLFHGKMTERNPCRSREGQGGRLPAQGSGQVLGPLKGPKISPHQPHCGTGPVRSCTLPYGR